MKVEQYVVCKNETAEAEKWHLINHSVPESEMENKLNLIVEQILNSGPNAVKATRELICKVVNNTGSIEDLIDHTTQLIAELRASDEGQEGMASFLEKRKAGWVN